MKMGQDFRVLTLFFCPQAKGKMVISIWASVDGIFSGIAMEGRSPGLPTGEEVFNFLTLFVGIVTGEEVENLPSITMPLRSFLNASLSQSTVFCGKTIISFCWILYIVISFCGLLYTAISCSFCWL